MLRVVENITDAVKYSTAFGCPLLVVVHAGLPAQWNNAHEATSTATYSFLAGEGSADVSANSSMVGEGNSGGSAVRGRPADPERAGDDAEEERDAATASDCMTRSNAQNAHLGRLRATADGAVNPSFALGELKGGPAQREALMTTLLNLRLSNVCLAHFIDESSPNFKLFQRAMPSQQQQQQDATSTAATATPRVHVFPSIFYAAKQSAVAPGSAVGPHTLFPFVLAGAELTPAALHNAVKMCLQVPFAEVVALSGRRANFAGNPQYAMMLGAGAGEEEPEDGDETGGLLLQAIAGMNREARRAEESARLERAHVESRPLLPGGSSANSSSSNTTTAAAAAAAAAAADSAAASTLLSSPPRNAGAAAAGGLHLIHLTNLPPHGSKRKTILTAPAMTARTAWVETARFIEKAKKDIAAAKESGEWDGAECDVAPDGFYLTVVTGAEPVALRSVDEAAALRLQDYPSGTSIRVCRAGEPPTDADVAETTKEEKEAEATASSAVDSQIVCDGNVCRRVPVAPPAAVKNTEAASDGTSPSTTAAATAAVDAVKSPAEIQLRCSLPNGKTENVRALDPSTSTLSRDVRPVVAAALNSSAFAFVLPFPLPAKRFSVDEDEARPLRALGIRASCGLRVVSTAGAKTAASPGASAAPADFAVSPADAAAASGIVQQFMRMMRGQGRGPHADDAAAAASGGGRTLSGAPGRATAAAAASAAAERQRVGSGFRSMAEMRNADDDDDRQQALDGLRRRQQQQQLSSAAHQDPHNTSADNDSDAARASAMEEFLRRFNAHAAGSAADAPPPKKSNRYFGGDSTEYYAAPTDDSAHPDGGGNDGGRPAPAPAPMGDGHRLGGSAAGAARANTDNNNNNNNGAAVEDADKADAQKKND